MIVAQTIFDEDKGDGIVFDLTNFDVSSFEELDKQVIQHWSDLINKGVLIVEENDGQSEILHANSGQYVVAYWYAYKNVSDANSKVNGLIFANTINFYPERSDYEGTFSIEDLHLFDYDESVLDYWGVGELVSNPPVELTALFVYKHQLHCKKFLKKLFEIYQAG